MLSTEPLTSGTGAATGTVTRLVTAAGNLIRKEFRPVTTGRHAPYAADPRHWAYWRREPLAYASGLLPEGAHGLRAPRCLAVEDDAVYLEEVTGSAVSPREAARALGAWQAATLIPDVSWLAGHQLAQRVAAIGDLDWTGLDADPRHVATWARREALLAALADVPHVLTHGDFHPLNLIASGDLIVVLDWGTLGASPVGSDLAHLELGTGQDLLADYLDGLAGAYDQDAVRLGYETTLRLTAAGREHWRLTQGI